MPGEMTYHEKSSTEASPLNRALPGYDTEDTVALLYEAALRKTFEEMETDWHRNDHDLQTLVVPLAENCYYLRHPGRGGNPTNHHALLQKKKSDAGTRNDKKRI